MLTNPADYIKYYVDILQKEYNLNDLKIDYHGFAGFIMNLFGWTNFDIKQYYDYLYKEGFLATADETKNLYLHASKHNYPIDYATPAQAFGNLVFDFSVLPIRAGNVKKREVILPDLIQITAGPNIFTSKTKYKFIEEVVNNQILYYCIITPEDSKQRIISSSNMVISVPFYNFYQQELLVYTNVVPNYNYGTYNQYNITLAETDQISNLEVSIRKSGSSTYEPFEIKYIKAFETPISKAIFLNRISDKSLVIETGNGYHGLWIPNSIQQINLWVTKGSTANLLKVQSTKLDGSLQLINYDVNNSIINSNTVTITDKLLLSTLSSSTNGKDILLSSALKNDIVKWVESRDNLINKKDFYNIFSKSNKDFNILFKKSQLVDNNFYFCKLLRDQYQNILKTTNHTYKCVKYDSENLIQNIFIDDQYYLNSILTTGRYYYKIVAIDKFYEAIPSQSISQTLEVLNRAVVLKWSPVENAEYYKVYGRNTLYNQYWIVNKDQLSDDGFNYFTDIGQSGTSKVCKNVFSTIPQINFPEFDLNLKETINITDDTYIWKRYESLENAYYIENKTFWKTLDIITYNTTALFNVNSVAELIENSWIIYNSILYIRLDTDFDITTSTVIIEFNNDLTFFSPFIYKYNSFFNWFEGHFIFDNMIQYPINSNIVEGFTPPIFYFNLIFDYTTNTTNIFIKSYQDIKGYIFKIKVSGFDSEYITITLDGAHFKHTLDGFITDLTNISIECYIGSTLKFIAISPLFQQVYLVRDQLTLLNYYDIDDSKYICNIPVLNYDNTNKDYIYSQLYEYIINSNISHNRMQSDSIQTRFLNSIFCDKYISKNLLKQQYDHNIILPLNINVKIKFNNTNTDFTSERSSLELLIATYLQEKVTGINIKFYTSQISELIHNYNSDIISVVTNIYDSFGTNLSSGIETIEENDFLFKVEDKLNIVKYTSVYWWWDIGFIVLELSV